MYVYTVAIVNGGWYMTKCSIYNSVPSELKQQLVYKSICNSFDYQLNDTYSHQVYS